MYYSNYIVQIKRDYQQQEKMRFVISLWAFFPVVPFKGLWKHLAPIIFYGKSLIVGRSEKRNARNSPTIASGRGTQWPQLHCYVRSSGHAETRVDAWRSVKTLFYNTSIRVQGVDRTSIRETSNRQSASSPNNSRKKSYVTHFRGSG